MMQLEPKNDQIKDCRNEKHCNEKENLISLIDYDDDIHIRNTANLRSSVRNDLKAQNFQNSRQIDKSIEFQSDRYSDDNNHAFESKKGGNLIDLLRSSSSSPTNDEQSMENNDPTYQAGDNLVISDIIQQLFADSPIDKALETSSIPFMKQSNDLMDDYEHESDDSDIVEKKVDSFSHMHTKQCVNVFRKSKRNLLERIDNSKKLFDCSMVTMITTIKPSVLKIEYQLHGNPNAREKVVLIMGLLSRKEIWGLTVEAILTMAPNRYHILTFDNRGIGNSDKPKGPYTIKRMANDTIALMQKVGWESAHIVGMSMGGMIALEIAYHFPEVVRTLCLMVTSAGFPRLHFAGFSQIIGRTTMLTGALHREPRKVVESLLRSMYTKDFLQQEAEGAPGTTNHEVYHDFHVADILNLKSAVASGIGQIIACACHRVSRRRLRAIAKNDFPILILSAKEDKIINPKCSLYLAKHLASESTQLLSFTSGHAINLECIDDVACSLLQHFGYSDNPAT